MLKKILPALLILLFSLPTYAYTVGADFVIVNNTDTNMNLIVSQPNGQGHIVKPIPAHETTRMFMENGDKTIWLYQASIAPFSIRDATTQIEYVNGRIAYYIYQTMWAKYSFLDSVQTGNGIIVDKSFACGESSTFENRIVLNGTPGGAAPMNPNHDYIHCEGLKATKLDTDIRGQFYKITCSDNAESTFLKQPGECVLVVYRDKSWYSNGCYWVKTGGDGTSDTFLSPSIESNLVKAELDRLLGKSYCQDFEKQLPYPG
jgi:hypothetical protein